MIVLNACGGASGKTSAASRSPQSCPGSADEQMLARMKVARDNVNAGHYKVAKRQALQIQVAASACVAEAVDVDEYHYVHSFAKMVEAQAEFALGDVTGVATFSDATREADDLAKKNDADPNLRNIAKNMVLGEHYVMKELLRAKKGQLIHPPPSPTP